MRDVFKHLYKCATFKPFAVAGFIDYTFDN